MLSTNLPIDNLANCWTLWWGQMQKSNGTDQDHTTPPYLLHATPRRVLARYLKDSSSVDPDHLLEWFTLIGDQWRRDKHTVQIRQWLSDHPDTYKATFKKSVEQYPSAFPGDRLPWFTSAAGLRSVVPRTGHSSRFGRSWQ